MLLRTFVRRCGVYLALAALTLQLALSFGHIHAHDIAYPQITYSKTDAVSNWRGPAKLEASTQLPSKLADDDEHCPICFSSFLLSTSFVPDPPRPPLSFGFRAIDRVFELAVDIVVGSYRAPFQSRAPPLG
ncbi:hypothetical protein SAMN05444158_4538 [Bradyrhizobium canariense]|uniref:DUF2946 domain-containing protein n=2 Tax=Bradyrhizobium canariense TaxID=255045 RepID=A0A1H1XZ29_9BRAD|nr:hypothetical protein SAMN05444158_4538 [Bradyrhizobium canariense]